MDYSRFEGIGDSSDEDGLQGTGCATHQPPPLVLDDLEDYFRRLEERRAAGTPSIVDVERFSGAELADLESSKFSKEATAGCTDCAICLADFSEGEAVTKLPCAAGHLFHTICINAALSRSVTCPLCRVNVKDAMKARSSISAQPPLTPRQLGFTRDGGAILRYQPQPPDDVPRPSYIPEHLRHQAEFVEIQYPEHGVARVWRVPRG